MRKVKRIGIPASLRKPEALNWAGDITEFYARPEAIRARQRPPFERYESLFLAADTVEALRVQFKEKCAYCESALGPHEAVVERFRPLMAAWDPRSGQESADHYGWFAFEWRNLMIACRDCASIKRNQFPLDTPRALPMTAWREAVASEGALLIDPCRDDPARHLAFVGDGSAVARSEKGQATINVLDLNRPALVEARRTAIALELELAVAQLGGVGSLLADFVEALEEKPHAGAVKTALQVVHAECLRRRGMTVRALRTNRDLERLRGNGKLWREVAAWFLSKRSIESVDGAPLAASSRDFKMSLRTIDPAHVQAVRIENFKGIERLDLDFSSLNAPVGGVGAVMLLGENAAGKSTVLQALALALMDERGRKLSRAQGADLLPRDRDGWNVLAQRPSIELTLSSGQLRRLQVDPLGQWVSDQDKSTAMVLAYGARRFFRATAPSKAVNRGLFDPFAVLEDPTPWLTQAPVGLFDAVARAMREILALHDDDYVYREQAGHVMVRAHGRSTPIERMSDGYRALFAMAVDIMRRMVEVWGNLEYAQGVVLIDEIDVHLHPRWKIEVMSALRRAMPRVQFIVTAHDALCLRGMRDGEVHVLYRDAHDRIRLREGLPNIELLRTDQLLTSDLFGLPSTASPETETALNRYAYLLGLPQPRAEQAAERDRLAVDLRALPRGDTPVEQLIGEATERYIQARRDSTAQQRGELREQALEEIVRRLERRLGAGAQE